MRVVFLIYLFIASSLTFSLTTQGKVVSTTVQPSAIPTYSYEVINTYPHDNQAFTQGLFFFRNKMYESTGLNGRSSLRFVELKTGNVRKKIDVEAQYFAEGMTVIGDQIYQLTWLSQKGFVYDRKTMKLVKEFAYTGEGWGLTFDGTNLILSDGTNDIRFLDPETFEVKRTIHVFANNDSVTPLRNLNELEYIDGFIYANQYQTPYILKISPTSGEVVAKTDITDLYTRSKAKYSETEVPNGIAYDADTRKIYITGKWWPELYELQLGQ